MGTILNSKAYKQLLEDDIEWLNQQKSTLEVMHIKSILEYEMKHLKIYDYQIEQLMKKMEKQTITNGGL